MKLNIGCGKQYKPDYCNIDLFDDLIADKKMSVLDLEFDDFSCEKVKLIQVVEHLGLYQAIYALSEIFRVLKPNGKLILETPDLEKAFQIYLNSDYEQKKDVLSWIYGLPHEGLEHKFCFTPQMLHEILEKLGFENLVQTRFYNAESIPTLQFTCVKPVLNEFSEIHQVFTSIRKNLLSNNIVNFKNLFIIKEQEDLLNYLLINTLNIVKRQNTNNIFEFVKKSLIFSPKIVKIFLENMKKIGFLSEQKENNYLEISNFLINVKFQNILWHTLKKAPTTPGSQKIIFSSVESLGLSMIDKLLSSSSYKSKIIRIAKELPKDIANYNISFFSPNFIKRKSLDTFYQGGKCYYNKKYKISLRHYLDAINLYRDNFLFYWNAAKVYLKMNLRKEAANYYRKTMNLLNLTTVQNKLRIKKDIKFELDFIKKNKILLEIEPTLTLDKYKLKEVG
ncbi:MAG: methyltransferase domain-containing protein [Promethearchaeota archaeon]